MWSNFLNTPIKRSCTSFARAVALCCLVSTLSGCLSSMLTGAQLVYDRHQLQQQITAHQLHVKANHAVFSHYPHLKRTNVSITVFNGDLLVVGQVPTQHDKVIVQQALERISGYRRLFNELTVGKHVGLSQSLKDSWITSKIRAKMVAENGLDPSQFKIITENNIVYILGDVKKQQAKIVIHLARTTSGVKKVVRAMKYFRYVSTAKTGR